MNYSSSQSTADNNNRPPAAVTTTTSTTTLPPYTASIPQPRHSSSYPSPRRPLFASTTPTTNNTSSSTTALPNPNYSNPQQQQQFHRPYADLFRPSGSFVHRPPPPQQPPLRNQIHDQTVTVASNHGPSYPVLRPTISPSQGFQIHRSNANFGNQMHMVKPNYLQQQQQQQQHPNLGTNASGVGLAPPIRGVPVYDQLPKVASSPSNFPDSNGYKHLRGKRKDDTLVTVRDRKVRITDGASLYALCRSWLRNGRHEDRQPVNEDSRMRLPRPIPAELIGSRLPTTNEAEEDKEDAEAVKQLSPEELLQRHRQRAKRVRSRLREARSQKIDRYKTRLSMLIPIHADHLEDDANS